MNKYFVIATCVASAFVAFFIGILVGEYSVQPLYAMLQPAFTAADSVFERPLDKELLVNSGIWNATVTEKTGVTIQDKQRAFGDYTLVSSGHAQQALLYDMDGSVVHEWSLPFRSAWETPAHVENPSDPALIYWRSMHLYPNGDLLALYETMGDVRGYGLVKMDANSRPIWRFSERTGGHFAVDADGFIYVIVKSIRHEPMSDLPQLVAPFIDDELVILSPDGKPVSRVSLTDQLVKKVGGRNLSFLEPFPPGALQVHSVTLVPGSMARKFPQIEEGDILLCVAAADMLAVLGRKNHEIKWVSKGPWRRPHYATASSSGDILLFDNRGAESRGMESSILVFEPLSQKISWVYAGPSYRRLGSKRWSSVRELPNKNLLVTETQKGRILELTPEKQVVWEWISPHRAGKDGAYIACVWDGQRYSAKELSFEFNKGGKKWF